MDNKLDNLDALRVFLCVAEYKSFKQASDYLSLPYSTASALIQKLENQLNNQLFIRSTRSVRLSEAGKRFYPKCLDLIRMADSAVEALQDQSHEVAGQLIVSAPFLVGQKYIAPVLPDFFRRYPNIRVRLQLDNQLVNTMQNDVDIVFRVTDQPMLNMIVKKLAGFKGGLYASDHYARIDKLPQTPAELKGHVLISNQPYSHYSVWSFKKGEEEFQHQFETGYACNEVDVIAKWVHAGIGIGWLPEVSSRSGLVLDRLQPVLADWTLQRPLSLCLGYHERRNENPIIGKFIEYFEMRFQAR